MRAATVTYCGIAMACSYEYDPAEPRTYLHPGSPENAALISCKVGGVDLMEMLTREQQDEIETLLLQADGEQAEIDAGEAADLRRTERAFEGFLA
jgi:hypothetical protein